MRNGKNALCTIFIFLLTAYSIALNEVPGPVVQVEPVKGVPAFTLNGQPFTSPCFETYHPQQRYFDQFAEAGVTLFSFNTNAAACDYGHSEPTLLGVEAYDYSNLNERVERVLKSKPDALILLRVNLGTPLWWLAKNPDELEVLDTGLAFYQGSYRTHFTRKQFPSIASEKWRQFTGKALCDFIDYVHQSDFSEHIFGYILAGLHTEEWYHWSAGYDELSGYSVHMQKAFQRWLREKYGTVELLRHAWNDATLSSFEVIQVPTREERYDRDKATFRNPSAEMKVIDFYFFYNELIPETIDSFAKIVREKTKGTKVVGAFGGYMYTFWGHGEYGQNAYSKLNRSPNIDYIFSTPTYADRTLGRGGDMLTGPNYSMRLHGQLWYHDNDLASFLCERILRRNNPAIYAFDEHEIPGHLEFFGATETPEESIWMYRRSMGFALCNGAYESFFDLLGGSYDHPELMAEVARLRKVAEESVDYDRSSNSEILIIADEQSCSYTTFFSKMLDYSLIKTQTRLIKVGAHADQIYLDDLELLDTQPYKLVVFLNGYHMTDKQREVVKRKLMRDNKYLLWCYAPGYFNLNKADAGWMNELTGMRIKLGNDPVFISPQIELAVKSSQLCEVIASQSGNIIGPGVNMCRLVYVDDETATALGTLPGSDKVTLAIKPMQGWTSVYSITPCLPPSAYRELARQAGVHIYNEKDDTFYTNKSYVCLHANGSGSRTITFPYVCNVTDAITRKRVADNTLTFTHDYKNGETLLLIYEQANDKVDL